MVKNVDRSLGNIGAKSFPSKLVFRTLQSMSFGYKVLLEHTSIHMVYVSSVAAFV